MLHFLRFSFVKAVVAYGLSLLRSPRGSSEFQYFPFDINKPLPLGSAELMEQLCGALEELAVHYRITDGTILGLYRDKRFIPHDTDIDIDILDCADQAKVHRCMRSFGMHLGRRAIIYGKIQQAAYFSDDYIIFDINYWYRDGDRVVNYSEPGYLREQPADYFSELGTLQWNGRTYPVPGKLEEWLAFRYGKDWKIPKRSKVDWKQECFDLVRLD